MVLTCDGTLNASEMGRRSYPRLYRSLSSWESCFIINTNFSFALGRQSERSVDWAGHRYDGPIVITVSDSDYHLTKINLD
jgi:hypothetical protein